MPAFLAPLAWNVARAGLTWTARRLAQRAATAAAQNALPAATAVGGAAAVSQMMSGANEEADQTLSSSAATEACAICASNNPCAALAAGNPASQFRGGAHGAMKQPVGDGLDSHHTPAASVSPLPRSVSPAIQMSPQDHRMTASNGQMPGSAAYRAQQARAVASGNFLEAAAMDVADIKLKFGNKYDEAIAQMMLYAGCLKKHGIVR